MTAAGNTSLDGAAATTEASIDLLSTAVVLLDADLRILSLNMAAETLFEVSKARAINRPITLLLLDPKPWRALLNQALGENLPMVHRERPLQMRSGTEHSVDVALSPLLRPAVRQLLLEFSPVDRLNAMSEGDDIWQSQLTLRAVVRGLAHEIKNPLGGIRGAAQLLARELPDRGLREYTDVIMAEVDRLRGLVDRLLGPRERIDARQLNIHEVLNKVEMLLGAETAGRLTIARDYDPSLPDLHGDPDQLTQALLNIVRNAWQATGDGGRVLLRSRVRRQYTIGRCRHRLVCAVDIVDDGPGIPEDMMSQLFLPTVSGRSDGSGLGLSIAQLIANRHRGIIKCHSEPGETTFTLLLPLEVSSDDSRE